MTRYEKELLRLVDEHYAHLSSSNLLRKLIEMGVVDYSRCKVLAVRESVSKEMKQGVKKIDAMWHAAEEFACSYEYVRKCVYYYNDINLC